MKVTATKKCFANGELHEAGESFDYPDVPREALPPWLKPANKKVSAKKKEPAGTEEEG